MTEATHAPDANGHEPGDENNAKILITAGILAASVVVVCCVSWGLLEYFRQRETAEKKGEFPLAAEENQLPIDKRLQRIARSQPLLEGLKQPEGASLDQDPQDRQAKAQPSLQEYGSSDEKGFARIPIDVALDRMLAKDRFPVQGAKKPEPENPR